MFHIMLLRIHGLIYKIDYMQEKYFLILCCFIETSQNSILFRVFVLNTVTLGVCCCCRANQKCHSNLCLLM